MGKPIAFSIILPCHNAEIHIKSSLDSVLSQSHQNFELIAINDGSTDKTLEILLAYSKKDSRINVFTTENKGISEARNLGYEKSKNEFILFLDADDLYNKERLQTIALYYDSHEKAEFIFHDYFEINEQGEKSNKTGLTKRSTYIQDMKNMSERLNDGTLLISRKAAYFQIYKYSWPAPITTCVKRSLIDKQPYLFDKYLKGAEDIELWTRLIEMANETLYIPIPLSSYRLHSNQITANSSWELTLANSLLYIKAMHYKKMSIIEKNLFSERLTKKLIDVSHNYRTNRKHISAFIYAIKGFKERPSFRMIPIIIKSFLPTRSTAKIKYKRTITKNLS